MVQNKINQKIQWKRRNILTAQVMQIYVMLKIKINLLTIYKWRKKKRKEWDKTTFTDTLLVEQVFGTIVIKNVMKNSCILHIVWDLQKKEKKSKTSTHANVTLKRVIYKNTILPVFFFFFPLPTLENQISLLAQNSGFSFIHWQRFSERFVQPLIWSFLMKIWTLCSNLELWLEITVMSKHDISN